MNSSRRWAVCCCVFLLTGAVGFAAPVSSCGISSPAFATGKAIPSKNALKGQNISPELQLKDVPAAARSLVLIVDDPDAPAGLWTHWLVWNLPVETTSIPEGQLPPPSRQGKNSFHRARYDGPAPPPGTGIHRYFFRLYALDVVLSLPAGAERAALQAAMSGHVVGTGETFGTYQVGPASSL